MPSPRSNSYIQAGGREPVSGVLPWSWWSSGDANRRRAVAAFAALFGSHPGARASLLVRTGYEPRPLLGKAGRTYLTGFVTSVQVVCGRDARAPGWSRPHPYCCEQATSQGHSLARRAEPTLQGSSPLCQVVCGRDARAPGWVSPASLLLRTGCEPGPLLGKVGRTYPCRVRHNRAKSYAGETPALPGGSRPHPYCCEQAASQGHSLARCAEPTLAGFVTIVPSRMRARRPRSRVGLARVLIAANRLRARATPWQGGPNPLLQVSSPLCQVVCGRDARVPGWVSPASLLLRTGCEPEPLPGRVRRTRFCRVRHLCAKSYAGGTPAFPGGSRTHPYCCELAASQGHSLAGCAEPAFAGVVTSVPSPMRARTPAFPGGSRPHPYCCEQAASQGHSFGPNLPLQGVTIVPNPHPYLQVRARATPSCAEPPLQGSSQSCQVLCGRDARVPGWVLSRLFFNAPPHPKFPRRWRHRRGDSGPGGGSACRGLPGIEARL